MKNMTMATLAACFAVVSGVALAQPKAQRPAAPAPVSSAVPSPVGEWLVEDGTAHIRVVSCDDGYWGVISWTKGEPGLDEKNPDPAKRARSVLGIPILLSMKPSTEVPGRWDGEVYNAQDGDTYTSHISLKAPDVLAIEGCVLGGWVCGGENWTRVVPAEPQKNVPTDQAVCLGLSK